MALGGQSRFYYPYPNPQSFEEVRANFDHIQERFDRIPVFAPQYTGALTGTIPTGGVATNLGAASTFYKDESWTDIEVGLYLVGIYNNTGAANTTILMRIVIDGTLILNIAEHHWNQAGLARQDLTSVVAIGGLKAGRHTIQFQGVANGGGVTSDMGYSVARIIETIPLQIR